MGIYPHNFIRLSCIVIEKNLYVFKYVRNKLKRTFFHFSNMQFSTKDQDNDYRYQLPNCAQLLREPGGTEIAIGPI